jgi:hypothetical protein
VTLSRRALGGVAAAVAVAVLVWFALRPSDESRIRAKLKALSAAVQVKAADMQVNPIGRMAHVSGAFESLFEPDVRVSVPDVPQLGNGRQALVTAMVAAPSYVRTLDVDFDDVNVTIDPSATSAAVGATASVRLLDRDGRSRAGKRAVDFRFVKIDGDWLITTATVWAKDDAGDVR